jgi:hypothetical protein
MFSALEALLTLGKCRELPVVGFVKGILVMGIIVSLDSLHGRLPCHDNQACQYTPKSSPF